MGDELVATFHSMFTRIIKIRNLSSFGDLRLHKNGSLINITQCIKLRSIFGQA